MVESGFTFKSVGRASTLLHIFTLIIHDQKVKVQSRERLGAGSGVRKNFTEEVALAVGSPESA